MLAVLSLLLAVTGSLAAPPKNQAAYDALQASGAQFPYGYYYIKNVDDGRFITYTRDSNGNNLFPTSTAGSLIEFQPHNSSTPWVRLRPDKSTKCASAQWGYNFCEGCNGSGCGCNWASVLYACQVDPRTAGSTLQPLKQFWIFNARGTSPESYNIIPVDHLHDMATRGVNSCTRTTGKASSTCIDILKEDDDKFAWYIQDANGNPISPSGGGGGGGGGSDPQTSTKATQAPQTSSTKPSPPTSTDPIVDVDPTRVTCSGATKTVAKTTRTVTKTATKTQTRTVTVTRGAAGKFVQANADFEWEQPATAEPPAPVATLDAQENIVKLPEQAVDFSTDDSSLGGGVELPGPLKWVTRPMGFWR